MARHDLGLGLAFRGVFRQRASRRAETADGKKKRKEEPDTAWIRVRHWRKRPPRVRHGQPGSFPFPFSLSLFFAFWDLLSFGVVNLLDGADEVRKELEPNHTQLTFFLEGGIKIEPGAFPRSFLGIPSVKVGGWL